MNDDSKEAKKARGGMRTCALDAVAALNWAGAALVGRATAGGDGHSDGGEGRER